MIKYHKEGQIIPQFYTIKDHYFRKGDKIWTVILNGIEVLHREDGPAFINEECQVYYFKGMIHRDDGTAFKSYYDTGEICWEIYYINGVCHREDGPAKIKYDKNGNILFVSYYLKGNTKLDSYSSICSLDQLEEKFGKILIEYKNEQMYE